MRNLISALGRILLSGVLALMTLSVYTYFFNTAGVHVRNPSEATDYKWEPNQRKSLTGEGFAWITMDGEGFNNRIIPEEIDILLMGSSQMEAVNVPQTENTGALLNETLENKKTYNIGISGHTIYNCVQNLESALAYYHPKEWVVMVCDTVMLEEEKMSAVLSGSYPRIPSYDTGLLYAVQKNLPVVKALYKSIEDWRSSEEDSGEAAAWMPDLGYEASVGSFLKKAAGAAASAGVKLLILYQPVTRIDPAGKMVNAADPEALRIFRKNCEENGILFLDMTADFQKLYEEKHILAHGFVNTAVGTGHLNAYGHQAIAAKIAEATGGE